ncbi:maleylacetoacetate isomerase [Sulfitobacter sp. HNIBRBA3233]|uniref:maleylacetoacetate isomerase n=1 Tax=Sulfitobacter marinivivus TaxID=3158558 RepID=UPI0032DF69FD
MTEVVLYDYWRSTASYRVRIALELARIECKTVSIDLLAGAQRDAAHLARNPQGYVPVLEIDGLRLTQSLAIIEYLDETQGLLLLPDDPAARARVRALSQVIAADTHPICNPAVVGHVLTQFQPEDAEAARIDWMRHFIRRGLVAFEALLDDPATGTFCHGETPSLADLCLVPQIYNARRWGPKFDDLARVTRISAAAEALPAFQRAAPEAVRPAD